MDRKLGRLIILAAFVAAPAYAQEGLDSVASPELCVRYAISLIGGPIGQAVPQAEVVAELIKRSEKCAPSEVYMEAARYRIQNTQQALERLEADNETRTLMQQQAEMERRAERSRLFREAARTLNPPPAPTTRTTCREFAGTITCDAR